MYLLTRSLLCFNNCGYIVEMILDFLMAVCSEWLQFRISMRDLPHACRVCFTVWAVAHPQLRTAANKDSKVPLGWVNCQLIDDRGKLRSGMMSFKLWPNEPANPIGTCVENLAGVKSAVLVVEFEKFALPVVFPPCELPAEYLEGHEEPEEMDPTPEETASLEYIISRDMLYELSKAEKELLWAHPSYCKRIPSALPKFMLSVPWNNRFAVAKAHRLLGEWAPLDTLDALEVCVACLCLFYTHVTYSYWMRTMQMRRSESLL